MTRSTIRSLLRRLLEESTAENWSDADLNSFIDVAHNVVQNEVRQRRPEAVISTATSNVVAGTATYAKPTDTLNVIEVSLLDEATGEYRPIRRVDYDQTRADPVPESSVAPVFPFTVWYHDGNNVGLYPTPTASVTSGLRIRHFATAVLSADSSSPSINAILHYAIVLQAALLAKAETQEDVTGLERRYAQILSSGLSVYDDQDSYSMATLRPDVRGTRRGWSHVDFIWPRDVV